MKWVKKEDTRLPIKSWCETLEEEALQQAQNLANHPVVAHHVALMPDCHVGYGMPIGGVIAARDAVIPNAVGVDIGCGMGAVKTSLNANQLENMKTIRTLLERVKRAVPVGEGHAHQSEQKWAGFEQFLARFDSEADYPEWWSKNKWVLDHKNLGTLGGGNHFIELQKDQDGVIWLMLHSGSRNLGHRIASYYHGVAKQLNKLWHSKLPDEHLAFLPLEHPAGKAYVRDMNFALSYALESRRLMMEVFKEVVTHYFPEAEFLEEINIHHNYAALEHHFGENLWIHRKGATSAKAGEKGIIPGSMGTSSYIVEGLGNEQSFMSCSHGAGRKLGRMAASRTLNLDECNAAMEGIVFDRWKKVKKRGGKKSDLMDFGESPLAYKDIDEVIQSEIDLIDPVVKLTPLGVIKG